MSNFTHLHVHSHYSLLDGLPKVDEIVDRVKELGMDSCALTDHGVMYGVIEFYKEAKKKGIKPIIGSEFYVAQNSMHQKRANVDKVRYHLILLAKNQTGYKNLVKLTARAHLEGFYYKPRIDEDLLFKHSEGLIAMSACIQGKIPQLLISDKYEEARKTALRYREAFGEGNFYLELQYHPNNENQIKANKKLIELSKETGIPLIATEDAHYLKPEDTDIQDTLMLINTGAEKQDPERLTMKSDDFSLKSPQYMKENFSHVPEAIENTQRVKEKCNLEFNLGEIKLPEFDTPDGKSASAYLRELCEQGLEERKNFIDDIEEARKRVDYELSIIEEMGYCAYFLIVQDFVLWAKNQRIVVGPGRGSAGGSLVSFLLGITDINPLKHGLIFQRFLNPERVSMPDIDIDFTDRRRDEVLDYVSQKYGKEKVAQIITFGTMAARAAIRDVGRAIGYSYGYCDKIARLIPFGSSLDQTLEEVVEFRQVYDTDSNARHLIDYSRKLEGCARHASTHACGVVISAFPLDELVPRQHPTQDDTAIVTQYEMESVEDLGLLKMDFLGLRNLTIIEDTLARVYKVKNKSLNIADIPFDDKATFVLLRKGATTGIFQLESDGMKRYLRQLKPSKFEDIIAMVALYRPGPMQFLPEYIDRKLGKKEITYVHPDLEPILKETYGICIFQEQLMRIAQDLAGFSLSQADVLRKAVGKKKPKLLAEQKEKFIKGMKDKGYSQNATNRLWEWIQPFARYGFNKSHSVAYGMIAYQTAYLKAHYPVEFMSALLTAGKDDIDKISFLMEECRAMNIEVLPPDINESFRNFSVVPSENKIRFGLLAIKNVGNNVVEAIIAERKQNGAFKSLSDFFSRINSDNLNKKSLESLIKAGTFDRFKERNKLLGNMDKILSFNREIRESNNSNQKSLFGGAGGGRLSLPELKLEEAEDISKRAQLDWEKHLLGLYVSGHPLDSFRETLKKRVTSIRDFKQKMSGQGVKLGGIISSIKKVTTKKGQPMLFLALEDLTGKAEVIVFPSILQKNSELLGENKIVIVEGKVDRQQEGAKLLSQSFEELVEQ